MKSKALRTTFVLLGLLVAAMPAWCQYRTRPVSEREGEFRLRLGAFRPEGDSEYWTDKQEEFTGDPSDLENAVGGIDYLLGLNNRLSLMFSGSYFEGDTTQSYRDFDDNFGNRIRHDTTLGIGSATAGLVLHLADPGASFIPYLGGGGGAYFWRLEENGDFIDFNNDNEIFNANLRSSGTAFGYYAVAGVEAPISRNLSFFAEGRWTQAEDDLSEDFEGFGKLDLSGREVSAGLAWSF
jgi:opacity protein-like surface antigen